jgi:hypothetical protein
MSMLFFGVVTPCELVGRYQRFGETYCHQKNRVQSRLTSCGIRGERRGISEGFSVNSSLYPYLSPFHHCSVLIYHNPIRCAITLTKQNINTVFETLESCLQVRHSVTTQNTNTDIFTAERTSTLMTKQNKSEGYTDLH